MRTFSPERDEFGLHKWFCDWVNCLGAPEKKFCDMYPNESCPAFQGCSVAPVQNF